MERKKKHICTGLLAHVDAGKTTLSEALLYSTGQIRSLGRVDHKDAYLDTDIQERERGITIFSKQAILETKDAVLTILDTPGHVDFSAEMERTLQVLDYAILVISGTDGVQGHTRTLWRLLEHYKVPVFVFINKMDLQGADRDKIQEKLKAELSDGCIDFAMEDRTEFWEQLAVCGESYLSEYLEEGEISLEHICAGIRNRQVFPCFYGSALKLEGVQEFLHTFLEYTLQPKGEEEFAARVYKIGRDARGVRLTYMKITGGTLSVKDKICYEAKGVLGREEADGHKEEKIDQIRIYSGDKFETVERVFLGQICAVTGLTGTYPGMGLGAEKNTQIPVLEPVLTYQVLLPPEINPVEMMAKLRQLEEEDPQLHLVWNEELREIHAQMMGQVQIEVLTRQIRDRFGVDARFGTGNIVYRETIAEPVEGVGHFEPLRHYAEVHLWLEPGEPGSGVQVALDCSEDMLSLNWQRLIATHVMEVEHPGVLTGSAMTDIKCTVIGGRAHLKHTEGGDFRQATYRAIRQGLKKVPSVLLEPYYAFRLEIPSDAVGRAMTDLQQRCGKFEAPVYVQGGSVEMVRIEGTAPVATMQDYMQEVHAYTKGMGHLILEVKGYDVCHNSEEVIENIGYDSELDALHPTGSVFCAHGAGFVVPWNQVEQYMHVECVQRTNTVQAQDGFSYEVGEQAFFVEKEREKNQAQESGTSWELDKELQELYAREFCMNKEQMEDEERNRWRKKVKKESAPKVKIDKKGNPIYPSKKKREECMIVDGYNIIFAWPQLKELAARNMDSARDKLKDILSNYQGYKGCRMVIVFDAYRSKGNPGKSEKFHEIEVVYTRTDETADTYIERMVHQIVEKYQITVVTNDGLEQLTVLGQGASRMSARSLQEEIERVEGEIRENMDTFLSR